MRRGLSRRGNRFGVPSTVKLCQSAAGQGKAGTESKGLKVLLASQLDLAGCREQEAEVGVADRITNYTG